MVLSLMCGSRSLGPNLNPGKVWFMADKFKGSVNLKLKSEGKLDKKTPEFKRKPEFQIIIVNGY